MDFIGNNLNRFVKQPLDRSSALQRRNAEYLWNSLTTGRPEGLTDLEKQAQQKLMNIMPMSGPSKVVSAGRQFIPAGAKAGISLMGQPVKQVMRLRSQPATPRDFIQGAQSLRGLATQMVKKIREREIARKLQQRNQIGQFTDIFK